MAVDKLVDSTQLDSDLTSVANAIRAKSGGSSQLAFPSGFVSEIGNIPSGGGNTYLTLLGSGSYTKTVNDGSISIPVEYTAGTVHLIKVVAPEPLSATAQGIAVAKYIDPQYIGDDSGSLVAEGLAQARGRKADDSYAGNLGLGATVITLSNGTLTVGQISTTYKWKANTYNWYIWGEPSS